MTNATGNFDISGDYSCPSPDALVYLVAAGGNTGAGTNSKLVLMSALGSCGNLSAGTFVNMSEVSTVASVFPLAQFMTPGSTAIGTSSTNVTGLVNAFKTAANVMDTTTGAARAMTPAGNGKVPQATINTLANIIAACVNTTGGGACSDLFQAATPPGGTAPADTLTALLDIALNPGNHVGDLFNVSPARGSFQPSLTGAPNDWTLSIEYTGGGLSNGQLLAVDGTGNIWVPNAMDPGTLSEFDPTGAVLSGAHGFSGGGLSLPLQVAIDLNGNVWAGNTGLYSVSEHTKGGVALSGTGFTSAGMHAPYSIALDAAGHVFTANGNSTVTELSSSGTLLAQIANGGLNVGYSIAIDDGQNIWVADAGTLLSPGAMVSEFNNNGTPVAASSAGLTGGGLAGPVGIAIDATGNAWVANSDKAAVSELSSSGTPLSGSGYVTPANVSAVAVDGNNTVWTANYDGSISHLSNSGASISPQSTGYISPDATGEVGIAIDASGNVWTTDAYVNSLFEYIGAASPATIPLQAAVKNHQLGKRP
jgi:hypothetical protein